MPRRILGLWVVHRKPHEPEVIPWREFMRLVEAAAASDTGKGKPEDRARALPPPGADRCQFVGRRGNACRRQPMRGGATRCLSHGGARQVPHHPSTVDMWRKGDVQTIDAAQTGYRAGAQPSAVSKAQARAQVAEVIEPLGIYNAGPHIRAGRRALQHGSPQDWQAWLTETHAIAAQMERTR